ncbi:hypothetical protein TNCV_2658751 [Trichonephila clavipes]|nr:hypothetical protein TNCV_2658751 [Trichonephila clavipes]
MERLQTVKTKKGKRVKGKSLPNQNWQDRRQEEEPMDWENVPFLPEVSASFVPFRPPRKMRSLISVQVSEPPSLSANRFPNMRALVPNMEGGVSLHSRGCPERLPKRAASRDQSSRPPSGVPRTTLFFERYLRTIATMPTFKLTRQVGSPAIACVGPRTWKGSDKLDLTGSKSLSLDLTVPWEPLDLVHPGLEMGLNRHCVNVRNLAHYSKRIQCANRIVRGYHLYLGPLNTN